MQVSVIIPVYNAEKYVREAVESALAQPETGEVILVEDASPDNALQVCKELEKEYSKVKLFQHPEGQNCGAGASRNLGIQNAQFDYIAFLDADDYYLPQHFQTPKKLFETYPDIDGVYEAVGTHFQDEAAKERWFSKRDTTLTTVREVVPPERLFEFLLTRNIGWFHTDGITVRKNLFERTGWFDEHLELRQDTAMWLKMAAVGKLIPGKLKQPVSIRRVHSENRVLASTKKFDYFGVLLWETLVQWSVKHLSDKSKTNLLLDKYFGSQFGEFSKLPLFSRKFNQLSIMIQFEMNPLSIVQYPTYQKYLRLTFGLSKLSSWLNLQ